MYGERRWYDLIQTFDDQSQGLHGSSSDLAVVCPTTWIRYGGSLLKAGLEVAVNAIVAAGLEKVAEKYGARAAALAPLLVLTGRWAAGKAVATKVAQRWAAKLGNTAKWVGGKLKGFVRTPTGGTAPKSAATPNLRDAALAIHNAADPARLRQSAVVVQSVRTAEGIELRAATSAGYFTREQQEVAQRLGIRMVTSRPPRTPGVRRPHAEDILEAHLRPGEAVEGWGISWRKQQLPLPCHECNDVLNRLGGWIDFFGKNEQHLIPSWWK
jgi:hypothetical protein